MPDELREPENRTSQEISYEAIRIFDMFYWLSSSTILNRGLQDRVISSWWPDQTPEEFQLMTKAFEIMDLKILEDSKPTTKVKKGEGSKIVGNKIIFEQEDF